MKTIRWMMVAGFAALMPAFPASAEPCGSTPYVPGDPGVVAPNCIDCSVAGGCTIYKYGLTNPDNYGFRRSNDPFVRSHEDFPTGSYAFNRQVLDRSSGCGPERDFSPIQGQAVLREQTNCVPTSEGPSGPGGCPVEIPRAISGVTPRQDKTTWSNGARVITSVRSLLASSSATLGGTSDPLATDPVCLASNIRLINAQGTRYLLSAARRAELGLPEGATYIKWSDEPGRGLYRHDDDSEFCCTSPTGLACASGAGTTPFQEYPVSTVRTCATPGRIYELLQTNDWIFEGDKNTPFQSDPNHIVPGEFHGVCQENRFQGCTLPAALATCTGPGTPHNCCTGAGAGTCGTECDALADVCDVREVGIRQTIPTNQASGLPDPTRCNTFQAVLRGTPGQYCIINEKYENPGDPGPGCRIWNFGFRTRPDLDCDGVPDVIPNGGPLNDLCPFFNEYDYLKDSDGDCAQGQCRGDECECTDQNQDGINSVVDIVEINLGIFNPEDALEICDGNNDLDCNVSDIVAANIEIFNRDSATCRHITSLRCGNSTLEAGEGCDDGGRCEGGANPGTVCDASGVNTCGAGASCVRRGGDGCSSVCRVEAGWTCAGQPSVCTRL